MKDEQDELLDQLFRTVRAMKVDTDSVGEHFETRLMASLEEHRESRALWSAWAWRLVPWFSIIVIIVAAGSVLMDPARSNDLFAVFTNGYDEYQATSLIAGG
jgi:lipopolysaccharide export LptBFGC system permease protein LptF